MLEPIGSRITAEIFKQGFNFSGKKW